MDDHIRQLRVRIRALHRGHARTGTRYPEELRAEIVTLARAGRATGRSLSSLAQAVGLSVPTLTGWLRRPTPGRLRRVTVAPSPSAASVAPALPLVLITPQGFRVEGLDLATLVTTLRMLT
jgi:transposase-like protein